MLEIRKERSLSSHRLSYQKVEMDRIKRSPPVKLKNQVCQWCLLEGSQERGYVVENNPCEF